MVLEMIRQGSWSLFLEAKKLKTNSKDYQPRVHSDQMVLVIARQDTGPCERRQHSRATFFEDTQMRIRKNNSRQPRNPIKK
jgi:hypothetical protein